MGNTTTPYRMLYIAKTNSIITRKGEVWEIGDSNTTICSTRARHVLPLAMIHDFDKHFATFSDPKTFRVGACDVIVDPEKVSVGGTIVRWDEFCHYVSMYGSNKVFKVQHFELSGVFFSLKQAQEIAEYLHLLEDRRVLEGK